MGISNYWEFGDGNDSYLTSPFHIYDSAGNFTVILTGTSLTNDCPAYDSVSLVVLPYPEVTGTPDINNGCIPLTVNFSNTVNSIGYFTWDFGDGNTSSQANPTHTYTSDGYYNVFVRFEDLSGCVDSFDFDVNPHPVPQAGFSINQLDTCVLPANFDFSNSSLGATNYAWTFGDSSNQNSQTNPAHSYTNDGTYDVMLHVSNTYGCEDSIVILINPVPNAFNALQLDTCVLPASFLLITVQMEHWPTLGTLVMDLLKYTITHLQLHISWDLQCEVILDEHVWMYGQCKYNRFCITCS